MQISVLVADLGTTTTECERAREGKPALIPPFAGHERANGVTIPQRAYPHERQHNSPEPTKGPAGLSSRPSNKGHQPYALTRHHKRLGPERVSLNTAKQRHAHRTDHRRRPGEAPRSKWTTRGQGNRQLGPLTSGEGSPPPTKPGRRGNNMGSPTVS